MWLLWAMALAVAVVGVRCLFGWRCCCRALFRQQLHNSKLPMSVSLFSRSHSHAHLPTHLHLVPSARVVDKLGHVVLAVPCATHEVHGAGASVV